MFDTVGLENVLKVVSSTFILKKNVYPKKVSVDMG